MGASSVRGGRGGNRGFETAMRDMQGFNSLNEQRARPGFNTLNTLPRGSRAPGFGLGTPVDPNDGSQFGLGRRIPADEGGRFGLGTRIPRNTPPRQGLGFTPIPAPPAEEKKAASSPAKDTTSVSSPLFPAPAPAIDENPEEDYGRYDSNPFVSDVRYGNFGIVKAEDTSPEYKRIFGDRYKFYAPKGDQYISSYGKLEDAEADLRKYMKEYQNEGSDTYGRSLLDMYDRKTGKIYLGEGEPVRNVYDPKTEKFIEELRKKPKEESRTSSGSFLGDPGAVKDRGKTIDSVFVDIPKTPAEEVFGDKPSYSMPDDAKDGFAYMMGGVRDGGAFDADKFRQEMEAKRGKLVNEMRQRREKAKSEFAQRRGSRGRGQFASGGGSRGLGASTRPLGGDFAGRQPGGFGGSFGDPNARPFTGDFSGMRGRGENRLRFGSRNDGVVGRRLAGGGVRGTRGGRSARSGTGRVRGAR